jgi:hypothetical protein
MSLCIFWLLFIGFFLKIQANEEEEEEENKSRKMNIHIFTAKK